MVRSAPSDTGSRNSAGYAALQFEVRLRRRLRNENRKSSTGCGEHSPSAQEGGAVGMSNHLLRQSFSLASRGIVIHASEAASRRLQFLLAEEAAPARLKNHALEGQVDPIVD